MKTGKRPSGAPPIVGKGRIAGLAATKDEIFAGDDTGGKVRVFSSKTFKELRNWDVSHPRGIAVDAKGNVWVIQGATDVDVDEIKYKPSVIKFSKTGQKLVEINEIVNPTALAIDNKGRLLITENGPKQQVFIYDISSTPKKVGTFGQEYGVYAGRRGEYGDNKFYGLKGIGTDAQGNIYVACNGFNWGGTDIRKFTPDGKLVWKLFGLEFVDTSEADPATDGIDVYTKDEHFVLDYSRKKSGSEWTYKGYMHDFFKYPEDPRLKMTHECTFVRRINGKPYLFYTNMYSSYLMVYRFEDYKNSEIIVPAAMISTPDWKGNWPPNAPNDERYWVWRDKNGNGRFEKEEYEMGTKDYPFGPSWNIDKDGNVWKSVRVTENGIRYFPMQGIDTFGNPIYTAASSVTENVPAPLTDPHRLEYDADSDMMYITGFTRENAAKEDDWGSTGSELVCFEGWKAGKKAFKYRINLGMNSAKTRAITQSFDTAGDYIFSIEGMTAVIHIYDKYSGKEIGTMAPGPEVNYYSGWIDVPNGIHAIKRTNGEYIILAEEDGKAKNLLYRWTPDKKLVTKDTSVPLAPSGLQAVSKSDSVIELKWDEPADDTRVVDYEVLMNGKSTGFTMGITSYTAKNLTEDTEYRFSVKAKDAYGNVSLQSQELRVRTTAGAPAPLSPPANVPDPYSNLALNKPVKASTDESANNQAMYAVDGDKATRWSSQYNDPQWIYVDLGSTQNISRVILRWEAAYGKKYKIQVSTGDLNNWTDVCGVKASDGDVDDLAFKPVNARYVRVYGTERSTEWGYSLYEFEVYK